MDLQYLRKLVKIFDDSTVSDFRLEEEGLKLRLSKVSETAPTGTAQPLIQMQSTPATAPAAAPAPDPEPSAATPAAETATPPEAAAAEHTITSPIVGTFYRAPAPDADPFVQVGDRINIGQTLCIVEAMKLMNEIESDAEGIVLKVLVENAQPVEYGQPLFLIKLD